ncbi:MAG: hypothetical protein CMA60_05710 [Euryarchaeota archaeon]|nr:hypothetical protein [Euryarchaeota archaeon]|tara:strand:+ start:22828 stop:23019 length:192 start_codon:yes stop_codon:yes gene_type:complete
MVEKNREQVVEELVEIAKIVSQGAEDWQFIENIIKIGAYLRKLDGDDSGEDEKCRTTGCGCGK